MPRIFQLSALFTARTYSRWATTCWLTSSSQWDRFSHVPLAVLAHSTHVKGAGTFDVATRTEHPRIEVKLASQISLGGLRAAEPRLRRPALGRPFRRQRSRRRRRPWRRRDARRTEVRRDALPGQDLNALNRSDHLASENFDKKPGSHPRVPEFPTAIRRASCHGSLARSASISPAVQFRWCSIPKLRPERPVPTQRTHLK